MSKRWIALSPIIFFSTILLSCNRPQISGDVSLPGDEETVPCSYEALIDAFETQDEITLSPGCTYTFSHSYSNEPNQGPIALPALLSEKTIHGNDATFLRSPAPGNDPSAFRFLYIGEGADVYIDDLQFEDGGWGGSFEECPTSTSCGDGGAIKNYKGSLSLFGTTFIGNGASTGGAISNSGNLEVESSLFEGNRARGGGALVTWSNQSSSIRNSTFRTNYAEGHGGAIQSIGVTTLHSCILDGNTSTDHGGAIYITESGYVALRNSTLSHNWAVISGAISSHGSVVIENSTIAHNFNSRGGVAGYTAIGAVDTTLSMAIRYSTIANNAGAGTAVSSTNNASVVISNSIIAHSQYDNCSVIVPIETEGGINFSTDDSCDGFVLVEDPLLAPLGDYGGGTPTMKLNPTSLAIDAAAGDCLETDQRGVIRPEGESCDLGAYEYGLQEVGALPSFIPEAAESGPERQVLTADPYLEGDEPSKPSHTGRIEQAVPCFNGPGPMYAVVSSLQPGALVEIIGISENGDYIVILNPCYPDVPCWAEDGSIEIHDQLDPIRVIPDPDVPEEDEEESSGNGAPTCQPNMGASECQAAGGTYNMSSFPPCTCPP